MMLIASKGFISQSRDVKASFQQVNAASSLSKTQASLVLHSFIATFSGSNINKYLVLNTVQGI